MTTASKIMYWIGLIALAFLQIGATVQNKNFWPLTSFNVFASASGKSFWVIKVVLENEIGEKEVVDPGQVLPVEFFKARSIMQRVFLDTQSQLARDEFTRRLIRRLSHERWIALDETLAPADIQHPLSIQVEAWRLTVSPSSDRTSLKLLQRLLLYRGPEQNH